MSVKIQITGEGLSYEKETTSLKAGQIIVFLNPEEGSDEASVSLAPSQIASTSKSSPIEILEKTGAVNNAQKITAFAYYLYLSNSQDTFTSEEIKNLFRRTGTPTPLNFNRDLKSAMKIGYIFSQKGNTGELFLTEKGLSTAKNGFSEAKPTRKKVLSSIRNIKKLEIKESVKALDIDVNLLGYPKLHQLSKGDQVLWILAYVETKSIETLNSKEIEYLSTRFKLSIEGKNVPGLTVNHFKKGYLKRDNDGEYRILQNGITYLKSVNGEVAE